MHIGKSYCFLLCTITMLVKISSFRSLRNVRNFRTTVAMAGDKSSAPPADPINFLGKFRLPQQSGKMKLEAKNVHPLDSKMVFDSDKHKYYFDGIEIERSVTEVVSNYFEVFDADLIIRRMMTGSNWPRPEYTQKNGEAYTEEEIKKKWANIGEYAKNTGTWMHFNIERYVNGLAPSPNSVEIPKFIQFFDDHIKDKMEPFRTEWRIAAPDMGVAGSVDFVGKFPDGTFALIDWKRSKDLAAGLHNRFGKRASSPIEHVDECDGSKFFLQLNIYRYILQKYYDIQVSYMAVASFHPNTGDTYFMTEVPVWESEVESIFAEISRRRIQVEDPRDLEPPKSKYIARPPLTEPSTEVPF